MDYKALKILQISIEVNSGSVGRIAEQIGQTVIESGWESYITYARNNLPSTSEVIRIGSSKDVYFHVLETRIFDNHAFGSVQATKSLIKKIDEINPDIIHLHHLHGYFINIEILFNYLAEKNKPIVWTFHDCWSFTGHCAYFEYVNCSKWIDGCYDCEQKKEYPKSLLFDRSKKNYIEKKALFNSVKNMTIVPVSYWLGDLVKESFLKSYPIEVIQNGIDIDTFTPRLDYQNIKDIYKISDAFIILGVASTWEPRKGLKYFIELDKILPEGYLIVIVGLTKSQQRDLPSSIVGIQRTESLSDLVGLYSMADVFVNPTLEDTFPTTNLESLACGTPVITFLTGGSVESVSEDTGIVVPKGDTQLLLNAIVEIRNKTKSFYTHHCRARAIELYDKKLKFQEYIGLYKRLIDEK